MASWNRTRWLILVGAAVIVAVAAIVAVGPGPYRNAAKRAANVAVASPSPAAPIPAKAETPADRVEPLALPDDSTISIDREFEGPQLPAEIRYSVVSLSGSEWAHDSLQVTTRSKTYQLFDDGDDMCLSLIDQKDFDGNGSMDALLQRHPGCHDQTTFKLFFISALDGRLVKSEDFGTSWHDPVVEKWKGHWTVVDIADNEFSAGPNEPLIETRRRFVLKEGKAIQMEEVRLPLTRRFVPKEGLAAGPEAPPEVVDTVKGPALRAKIEYGVLPNPNSLGGILQATANGKTYQLIGAPDPPVCVSVVDQKDFDGNGSVDALVLVNRSCGGCCASALVFVSALNGHFSISQDFGASWYEPVVELWKGRWSVVAKVTNEMSGMNPGGTMPRSEPLIEIRRRFVLENGKAVKVEETRQLQ